MRRNTKALLLLGLAIVLMSISTVEGYTPQFNAEDEIDSIINAVSFKTHHGLTVNLANIQASNLTDISILNKTVPVGTEVYFDILSQSVTNNNPSCMAVVFVNESNEYYCNLNQYLLSYPNYQFLWDNGTITPYTWQTLVIKQSLVNNTNGLDLSDFESNRATLVGIYSAQTLAHIGYLIPVILAIIAWFATLANSKQKLLQDFGSKTATMLIGLTLVFLLSLFVYFTIRLMFWSWMTDAVLAVTPQDATQHLGPSIPTLASGVQTHLTDLYKDNWLTFPNLFYTLDQKYFPFLSVFLLLPTTGFVSLCITRFVIGGTKPRGINETANFPWKWLSPLGITCLVFLILPSFLQYSLLKEYYYSIISTVTIFVISLVLLGLHLTYVRDTTETKSESPPPYNSEIRKDQSRIGLDRVTRKKQNLS